MPELPEVETVRAGLARHVLGRTVMQVQVLHPRAVRRQVGGAQELAARLTGLRLQDASRRGKYLWLCLADPHDEAAAARAARAPHTPPTEPGSPTEHAPPTTALLVHLGMSGQMLVRGPGQDEPRAGRTGPGAAIPAARHLRVRLHLDDGGELWFVDQRTFGHVMGVDLVPTTDGPAGESVPAPVAHIARDLMDPHLDLPRLVRATRAKRTEIKRALLDQTLVSGIGNIYADEALWRARLHGTRPTDALAPARLRELYAHAADVLTEALAAGGTSFDELYVDVNGASGYFSRSLNVYGREGRPCRRCGRPIRREHFMNRSSYVCRTCQRLPRTR